MSIGENIARLRKEKGWTQVELGEKLGVSNQAVSKWESEMTFPDVMLLPHIAELFEVSIDDLYNEAYQTDLIIEKSQNKNFDNEDNRVLVISVKSKDTVIKTRVPVKAIRALLVNEKVKDEINLEDEEATLLYDVIGSAKGESVNVDNGNKKTTITIEDYEDQIS